jgi:hypothetical protein
VTGQIGIHGSVDGRERGFFVKMSCYFDCGVGPSGLHLFICTYQISIT